MKYTHFQYYYLLGLSHIGRKGCWWLVYKLNEITLFYELVFGLRKTRNTYYKSLLVVLFSLSPSTQPTRSIAFAWLTIQVALDDEEEGN